MDCCYMAGRSSSTGRYRIDFILCHVMGHIIGIRRESLDNDYLKDLRFCLNNQSQVFLIFICSINYLYIIDSQVMDFNDRPKTDAFLVRLSSQLGRSP